MSGEAVPQGMRMNIIAESSACGGFPAGLPHYFAADWTLARMPAITGKQPRFWLSPETTPVLAQGVKQFRAQHDIAILASLATSNVNHHSLAVDIADLQL